MKFNELSRRDFLKVSAAVTTVGILSPSTAFASYPDKPRTIAMSNLHTGESLESCYFDGEKYIERELSLLNQICRDFRQNEAFDMDRELFNQVSQIQQLLGTSNQVMIISGYRSPKTNAALRANSSGVAKKSYHMRGMALDFRLDGIPISQVRDAAMSLKAGGVGYYQKSQFVHIDTGPVRSW